MKLRNLLLVPVALMLAGLASACITLPEDTTPGTDDAAATPTSQTTTEPTTTASTPESTAPAGEELQVTVENEIQVGATTTVRVTTADGAPAEDCTVIVNGEEVGTTDSEGRITVTIPQDATEVVITARLGESQGEVTKTVGDTGDDAPKTDLKVFVQGQANPGSKTMIVVRTSEGTPAEGAEVIVNEEEVGTTGSDGKIEITVPADAERLKVMVKFNGKEGTTQKAVTEPHLEVTVKSTVTVESTTTVTVRTPDGSPAEGATVIVNGEEVGTTGADGRIEIEVQSDTTVLVIEARLDDLEGEVEADVGPEPTPEATPPATGTPSADPTTPATENLQLSLSADLSEGAVVILTVMDAEGNPIEGATVTLNGQHLGTTDSNGKVEFEVPVAFEYRFTADANGSHGELVIDFNG